MCGMEALPMWICGHAAKSGTDKADMVTEYVSHIRKFICGSDEELATPKWSASISMEETVPDYQNPRLPGDRLGIMYGK